ncbi:alpha,alpha-trehalase nth1 [Lithohypha guttulata]|uniref:Trehalase n=1 Tax=Lithohypha guttulata TaxID=1690604 RepID=A0AAN7SUH1_9EURO|nr:alpha,alpha-trehalase nth1 [Lithohypha guttulata]
MSVLGRAPTSSVRRSLSIERKDPFAPIETYYDESFLQKKLLGDKQRAISSYTKQAPTTSLVAGSNFLPRRRGSHDEFTQANQELLVNVESTINDLLDREDKDRNYQITIEDNGPKHISVGTLGSAGYRSTDLRGNYVISNLLQELTLAQDLGKKVVKIHRSRLNENPVTRLDRRIRDEFWKNLERSLDANTIEKAGKDPKDWTDNPRPRIYVPHGCPEQYEYYTQVAKDKPEMRLDVRWLPKGGATAEFVKGLNDAPGILALAMRKEIVNGKETLKGEPFTVPGGRFNELYGWDSYMVAIGLLEHGRVAMAKSMAINFAFCIQHYGKILNANRSYYLSRSQPPFLTDFALQIYEHISHEPDALDFLKFIIQAAIKEYYNVWMSAPRYDPVSGLSRYRPDGLGVPPETEATHFVHVITPYAEKLGITFEEYVKGYNSGDIKEPELDDYFLHDRAVRESGHDTSYRLEGCAANLATVDLNSLLYKYECDIANCIRTHFRDHLTMHPDFQTEANRIDGYESSAVWHRRARMRKARMDKYMWNAKAGMYFDYDTVNKKMTDYESATTFWAMWAGLASPKQAAALVLKGLPKFEEFGGLVSGTEKSRGEIHIARPNRQWDYPFGWAPQQILAWGGLLNYGYTEEAHRLCYKWLYMVIKAFVDFNGVVVEKYDVTRQKDPHTVEAEYGNQGADFKGVPREGFGWVNASFVYGLSFLPTHMKRALGTLTPWTLFEEKTAIKLDQHDELTIHEEDEEFKNSDVVV